MSGVDVVCVNYKTTSLLNNFINSFNRSSLLEKDLYIVDNDPDENDVNINKSISKDAFYLYSSENIGYAKACNLGANWSELNTNGKYIAFFNSDCVLLEDTLEKMINGMDDLNLDIAGPLQYNRNFKVTHGGIFGSHEEPKHRGWRSANLALFRDVKKCISVSGSAYFIKRSVWNALRDCPLYRDVVPEDTCGAFLPTPHYWEETFCFAGDTVVFTTNGPKEIRDIVSGDEVFAWDEERNVLTTDIVTGAGLSGYKKVKHTKFNRATSISATEDHRFLLAERAANGTKANLLGWGEIERDEATHVIKASDFSMVPRKLNMPDRVTEDHMSLFGAWIGGGSYNLDRQIVYSIPVGGRVHDAYITLATKTFNKKIQWTRRGVSKVEEIHADTASAHINGRTFRVCSVDDVIWMKSLGFTGTCKEKRVPSWVFSSSQSMIWSFLAGVVDSGGHINKRGGLSIRLANRMLVHDLYLACLLVGLTPGAILFEGQDNPFKKSQPQFNNIDRTYSWGFTVYANQLLKDNLPTLDPLYQERLAKCVVSKRSGKADKMLGLSDGLTSRKIYESVLGSVDTPVYDISTSKNGNFFANGILVHNCSYHAHAHGYEVTYFGEAEMIHEWHKSSKVGSVEKQYTAISQEMFRKACDHHGILHD